MLLYSSSIVVAFEDVMLSSCAEFTIDYTRDRRSSSRKEALFGIASRCQKLNRDLSASQIALSFVERERIGSTASDRGVAFPRAVIEGDHLPLLVVTKLEKEILFDHVDYRKVDVIISIVGSSADCTLMNQVTGKLRRILRASELLAEIRTPGDAEKIKGKIADSLS